LMLIKAGKGKDDHQPDPDGSHTGCDANMAHFSTGIRVIMKSADLDSQDEIENSAE
jgi:hypothetical protein